MPTLEDIRLGQLTVAKGLAQTHEVEECLARQHQKEQDGLVEPLSELLIASGYITRSQLTRLLSLERESEQKVTRIGHYELLKKLGEGGMGAVYQAKDVRSDLIVALKVLPRSRARDTVFRQRFEQEVRVAFALDHPNIVRGLDQAYADGYHFLVMEFVQGNDVYALLEKKGRLTEAEALDILEQIASALNHIHAARLVHRDIKPENILVSETGVAKLADLGLAVNSEIQGRNRLTQTGIAMGTPYYLSPEQIEGKTDVDIRSDLYALGATVYEMVTGRPPFEGETPTVVMLKHLNEQVPSPHDIDRGISYEFCHMLERMMAKDPEQRYQTPAELIADLLCVKAKITPMGVRPPKGKSSVSRPETYRETPRALSVALLGIVPALTASKDKNLSAHKIAPYVESAVDRKSERTIEAPNHSKRGTRPFQPVVGTDPILRYAFIVGIIFVVGVLIFIIIHALREK